MFDRIKRFARSTVTRIGAAASVLLRGSHYDNASYGRNDKHFSNAKDLPPIQINTPDVRQRLRARANYERDNNCYLSGLVDTMATDVVGYVPPKLQVLTDDPALNSFIEKEWEKWSEFESVNLHEKLKIMDMGARVDGESFPLLVTDDFTLGKTGYGLNVVIIPASRVRDDRNFVSLSYTESRTMLVNGEEKTFDVINDDGVIVDAATGRPIEFKVVPIGTEIFGNLIGSNAVTISARYMKQWFRPKRTGQFRGVCEVAAALDLYAQLRRMDIATLTSAEIAAMLAGVMKTTSPPEDGPPKIQPGTELALVPGSLIALPDGWEAGSFPANQPISTYEMYVNIILRQIGRLLNAPFGVVAGDYSRYNYSSARLEVTGYDSRTLFDRYKCRIIVLNPIFEEWLIELLKSRPDVSKVYEEKGINYTWSFTTRPSLNPSMDASVDDMRLKNMTDSYANVYSARGMDWEEQFEQIKKERINISQKKLDNGTDSAIIDNGSNSVQTNDVATAVAKTGVDVQATALNGAQVTSLVTVIDKLASGQYPADSVKQLIMSAFPGITDSDVNRIVNGFLNFTPEAPISTPNAVPAN